MKSSPKRAASRRQSSNLRGSRSRRALEEAEKQLAGAGWTLAATNRFFEIESDTDRLAHVCGMFSVTDDDYKYTIRSTYLVDFHWANGLYCMEKKFDAPRTQFFCRALQSLFETVTTLAKEQPEEPNFDSLRDRLLNDFQTAFFEFNGEEFKFTPEETRDMLAYVGTAIIKPVRLIYLTYHRDPFVMQFLDERKLFAPPPPDPLEQCVEELPMPLPGEEFLAPVLPRRETLNLADVKEALKTYTDSIISVIGQRYDNMSQMVEKLGRTAQ